MNAAPFAMCNSIYSAYAAWRKGLLFNLHLLLCFVFLNLHWNPSTRAAQTLQRRKRFMLRGVLNPSGGSRRWWPGNVRRSSWALCLVTFHRFLSFSKTVAVICPEIKRNMKNRCLKHCDYRVRIGILNCLTFQIRDATWLMAPFSH